MSQEKRSVPKELKDFLISCSPDLKICDNTPGYFDAYFLENLLSKQGDYCVACLLIDKRSDKCDLFEGLVDFGFDVTKPVRLVSIKRAIKQLPEEVKKEVSENPFVKNIVKDGDIPMDVSIPLFLLINKSCSDDEQKKIYEVVNEKEFLDSDLECNSSVEKYFLSRKELSTLCSDCEAKAFRRGGFSGADRMLTAFESPFL